MDSRTKIEVKDLQWSERYWHNKYEELCKQLAVMFETDYVYITTSGQVIARKIIRSKHG